MTRAAASLPRRLCTSLAFALAFPGATLAQAHATHASPHARKAPAATPAKPTRTAASYNIGLSFGQGLRGAHLTTRTLSILALDRGLRDAMRGKTFNRDDQLLIRAYVIKVGQALGRRNLARAKAFLARNAKRPGVVTTPSGLEYKVLTPGKGDSPTRMDTVSVLYRGTLLDGTEFDGTDKRGNQPSSFPLGTVIPGWQEALSLMKPGARWEIFIPPNLAYNMNQRGPIPPGSLLVFNVQLLKVTKPTRMTPPRPVLPHR